MAGREVREYTNLSDPKGTHFDLNKEKLGFCNVFPCNFNCGDLGRQEMGEREG